MPESKIILYSHKGLTLCSLIVVMLFFQNCGVSEEDFSDELAAIEQAEADALPFAYDVTIDQIAYMSCDSDTVNNSGTVFNFKAGAFGENEGIKFRDNFRSAVAGKSNNYVLTRLAASKRNVGAGVVLSVRERGQMQGPVKIESDSGGNEEDFGNIISPMIWNPVSGITYTSNADEFSVSEYLWNRPDGVNYLTGFPQLEGKSVDAEISYNVLGAQQVLRDSVANDSYLTLTFATLYEDSAENPGEKARAPTSETGDTTAANTSVWGKGYSMSFAQVNPSRANSPSRALASVTGFNLENESSLDESWVCPTTERYIIIKDKADALRRYDAAPFNRGTGADVVANNPWDDDYDPGTEEQGGYLMNVMIADSEDIDDDGDSTELLSVRRKVVCPPIPDNIPIGASEHELGAWTRIRNILPSEDWYVFRGDRYNCVIPKRNIAGACYGAYSLDSSGGAVIQYLPDEDMPEFWIAKKKENEAQNEIGTTVIRETECEGSTTGNRYCPHVISVCYKQ